MAATVKEGADVLAHVIEQLSAEFGDRIDPSSIRQVATQEVALFENAKVRTHVQVIAWRLGSRSAVGSSGIAGDAGSARWIATVALARSPPPIFVMSRTSTMAKNADSMISATIAGR